MRFERPWKVWEALQFCKAWKDPWFGGLGRPESLGGGGGGLRPWEED